MAHRVNFNVYRYGKTVKWNYATPYLEAKKNLRVNYVMLHWTRKIMRLHMARTFRYFYSHSGEFPALKIIGYRRIFVKRKKKIKAPFRFLIKSSRTPVYTDIINDVNKKKTPFQFSYEYYTKRRINNKLRRRDTHRPSKYVKSGYGWKNMPLLGSRKYSAQVTKLFHYEMASNFSILPHSDLDEDENGENSQGVISSEEGIVNFPGNYFDNTSLVPVDNSLSHQDHAVFLRRPLLLQLSINFDPSLLMNVATLNSTLSLFGIEDEQLFQFFGGSYGSFARAGGLMEIIKKSLLTSYSGSAYKSLLVFILSEDYYNRLLSGNSEFEKIELFRVCHYYFNISKALWVFNTFVKTNYFVFDRMRGLLGGSGFRKMPFPTQVKLSRGNALEFHPVCSYNATMGFIYAISLFFAHPRQSYNHLESPLAARPSTRYSLAVYFISTISSNAIKFLLAALKKKSVGAAVKRAVRILTFLKKMLFYLFKRLGHKTNKFSTVLSALGGRFKKKLARDSLAGIFESNSSLTAVSSFAAQATVFFSSSVFFSNLGPATRHSNDFNIYRAPLRTAFFELLHSFESIISSASDFGGDLSSFLGVKSIVGIMRDSYELAERRGLFVTPQPVLYNSFSKFLKYRAPLIYADDLSKSLALPSPEAIAARSRTTTNRRLELPSPRAVSKKYFKLVISRLDNFLYFYERDVVNKDHSSSLWNELSDRLLTSLYNAAAIATVMKRVLRGRGRYVFADLGYTSGILSPDRNKLNFIRLSYIPGKLLRFLDLLDELQLCLLTSLNNPGFDNKWFEPARSDGSRISYYGRNYLYFGGELLGAAVASKKVYDSKRSFDLLKSSLDHYKFKFISSKRVNSIYNFIFSYCNDQIFGLFHKSWDFADDKKSSGGADAGELMYGIRRDCFVVFKEKMSSETWCDLPACESLASLLGKYVLPAIEEMMVFKRSDDPTMDKIILLKNAFPVGAYKFLPKIKFERRYLQKLNSSQLLNEIKLNPWHILGRVSIAKSTTKLVSRGPFALFSDVLNSAPIKRLFAVSLLKSGLDRQILDEILFNFAQNRGIGRSVSSFYFIQLTHIFLLNSFVERLGGSLYNVKQDYRIDEMLDNNKIVTAHLFSSRRPFKLLVSSPQSRGFLNSAATEAENKSVLPAALSLELRREELREFVVDRVFFLNLSMSFYKIFGIYYNIEFYPISAVFMDNGLFQTIISNAAVYLQTRISRNIDILNWLNEFAVVYYASLVTRTTSLIVRFMSKRFRIEYYWAQPAAYMFSVVSSVNLKELGISGIRFGFHGKFGGQERAFRLYKVWGRNPCLRNSHLIGSYSSAQVHSRYGITDIHLWLTYF